MDGSSPTLYDHRPCTVCGGAVRLLTGVCESCTCRFLRPQPGPQEQFLSCDADIVLYGGAAGAGKTQALLIEAGCYANVPNWVGLIVRHNYKELVGGAGVFNKAKKLFAVPDGSVRFRESPLDIRWPSTAQLEFRHLDAQNYQDYQGQEYAWIGIEEATHYEWEWVRYIMTRLRTDSGVKTLVRMTCNPEKNHWLRAWVDWYVKADGYPDRSKSGVIRYMAVRAGTDDIVWADTRGECAVLANRDPSEVKSFSYVAALIDDNPIGLALNPGYLADLAMAGQVEEERLRRGNWNATNEVGGMLRKIRWGGADGTLRKPIAPIVKWCRAWDKAATKPIDGGDPDYTAGPLLGWDIHGRFYVAGLAACREESPEVDELMRATAKADGKRIMQCAKEGPSDTGKSDCRRTMQILKVGGGRVVKVHESKNKVVRVQPMADALYRGMNGTVPALAFDAKTWAPRGWILNPDPDTAVELGIPHCANWFDAPYEEPKSIYKTLGELFWSQVDPFFNAKKKKDIPDAMADAFAKLSAVPSKQKKESVLDQWKRLTKD